MSKNHLSPRTTTAILISCFSLLCASSAAMAQSVCLPAPRLLTTMPMGGQVGKTVEVTITGDNIEEAESLSFSSPGITQAAGPSLVALAMERLLLR